VAVPAPLHTQRAAAADQYSHGLLQEHVGYAAPPPVEAATVSFSDAYHALIHSPALVRGRPRDLPHKLVFTIHLARTHTQDTRAHDGIA